MDITTHTILTLVWTMGAYYIGHYFGKEKGWIWGIAETLQMLLDKKYITVDDIEKINKGLVKRHLDNE